MTTEAVRPRRQTFSDRIAGRVPDLRPDRDISPALGQALSQWVDRVACRSAYRLDRKVALALGIPGAPDLDVPGSPMSFRVGLLYAHGPEQLDVVDTILALHPDRGRPRADDPFTGASEYEYEVRELDEYFVDAGSAYRVAADWSGLELRLDDTVTLAAQQAATIAGPDAGALLAEAWRHTYGLHPDPTTGYRDAVRAVEELACPLVLPNDEAATLGKVIAHLRQGGHKWAFALVDRDGANTVDPLVGMLDRLWTGQVSRHGGQKSRAQTPAEAQAAVHLAATLVQLLGAGALTRQATS